MLKIENLSVGIKNKIILNNINLKINKGEFHVIMGRNGSGKSTLSNFITGKDGYNKKNGKILYNNNTLLNSSGNKYILFLSMFTPKSRSGTGVTKTIPFWH